MSGTEKLLILGKTFHVSMYMLKDELAGIGEHMRVLLTSAGLETEEIKECFANMIDKEMRSVKALFIPTAAVDPGAIAVLPKCMNDLRKCGIPDGMEIIGE